MKNKIKSIVFDFDMTLINSMDIVIESYYITANEVYGKKITRDFVRNSWGKPNTDMIRAIFGKDVEIDEVKKKIRQIREKYSMIMKLFDGTKEILKQLKLKYKLGIVSSTMTDSIEINLKQADLSPEFFDFIQGAEQTDYHKPDPRVFDLTFEKLKEHDIKPDEIVCIGDSILDYMASKDAGITFIAVTSGIHTKNEFINLGLSRKYIITDLSKLETLLK